MTYRFLHIGPSKRQHQRMSWFMASLCALLIHALLPQHAFAGQSDSYENNQLAYATRMDYAHWHTESSRFSCRLSQDVKRFGTATFEERAGLGSRFTLYAKRNPMGASQAELVSLAPVWASSLPPRNLGTVTVRSQNEAIVLGDSMANQILAELQRGMAPEFKSVAWFDIAQEVSVGLSPTHFLGAFERYLECAENLFSKSFDQIARTRVHFDTDKHRLNSATKTVLDEIIQYSKLDRSVSRIYIDGHTDNVHESSYNIGLSKRRAKAVSAYMASQGIKRKKLVTRYHGERYPVVANSSDENRLLNRRVTVRLER